MIGVARDIAARGAVNGHARVDFIKISVAPIFEPECLLGGHAWPFIFGDFFALLDGPDGKKAEPGERAADAK